MNILVSGFEPFGSSNINPSGEVVKRLATGRIGGVDLTTCILPVDMAESTSQLLRAYEDYKPEAVLCLGEASQRAVISVERVAVNIMDYRIPDNQGNQVVDRPIVENGPVAYFCTLPVRAIYEALIADGIPAELSLSAGTFLCNQVLYSLLHTISRRGDAVAAGFVHLPSLPEEIAGLQKSIPSMSLETAVRGVTRVIECIRDGRNQNR